MTLLNRHRELVAKIKSVRYLHVVREYNAAADSLAGEALESKVSKVVLNDHRKTELKELNRIQEMIYEPSSDDIKAENTSSGTFVQIRDGKTQRVKVSATTRNQAKTKKKRVHFEDEVRHEPTADDIDPVTVQEERRRRIVKAQDEELRGSNLNAVLRGETTYKEAREAWKWAANTV
ncbi:hypothetical protein PHMEG_00039027 [Phytophthora megakarya]|uniref:RNase H type-1 domain-containing protein n=1 Tax=Phytophthora megakarya TaxID=4795 RepID=A0A225UFX1_9STRA|nr:hypothetical protein PHMEG_00039027 [Phytophthora megakarya]